MSHALAFVLNKAENAAIYTTASSLTVVFIVAPFKTLLKRGRKRISHALDSLDPDVPVGLTKQLDELIEKVDSLHGHIHPSAKR